MHADYAELLADPEVDAVVVATPVPTHYALAKQALEAGKHVFVEKPPAMRAVEMDELVALAVAQDRVLMPGHLLLYHPGVLKLKDLIASGELGDVLCVYGNRVNLGIVRSNENALWSLGVHDLSVILYLLDEDPELATAQGSASIHPGVEDVVFCFLRFPSGIVAHLHLSWLDPHKERRLTVVGERKMATFDDMLVEVGYAAMTMKGIAERAGVGLLVDRAAHYGHIRSECGRELDGHVAQPTETDDAYAAARTDIPGSQRGVSRDARAQERCSSRKIKSIGHAQRKLFAQHQPLGVTPVGNLIRDAVVTVIGAGCTLPAQLLFALAALIAA